MLSYPLITMGEFTHEGSRGKLLGEECDNIALREKYSIEKHVDAHYPKTYLWQCKDDNVVPYQNSILMIEALKNGGVEYEHFAVEGTAHGWGLATNTAAEGWLNQAVAFWQTDGEKI